MYFAEYSIVWVQMIQKQDRFVQALQSGKVASVLVRTVAVSVVFRIILRGILGLK